MDYEEFRNRLFEEAEEGYRDFVLGGIITERPLLGVRIPKCREMAREILEGDKELGGERGEASSGKRLAGGREGVSSGKGFAGGVEEFLKQEPVAFEEVMVRGFVIAGLPYAQMVDEMYKFIPLIDNWEVCDCFCAAMKKNISRNRAEFLDEIDKMLNSLDEFETRVGLVCLLLHYVNEDYLNVVFDRIAELAEYLSEGLGEMAVVRKPGEKVGAAESDVGVKGAARTTENGAKDMTGVRVTEKVLAWDAYYVKVAVAWLIATCFAKFPEETMQFFKQVRLPKWTFNKAILKTCESARVERDVKEELRELKRKREKFVSVVV